MNLRNLGEFDRAAPLYEEALRIKLAVFGEDHPSTALTLLNTGIFHGVQGHYDEAEPFFQRAVAAYSAAYGDDSPRTARAMTMYAVLLGRTGRHEEVAEIYRGALEILQAALGPQHPHALDAEYNLGAAYCNAGDYAECVRIIERPVRLTGEASSEPTPRYFEMLGYLGMNQSLAGLHDQGIENAMAGLSGYQASEGADHPQTVVLRGYVGRALVAADRYQDADSVLTEALDAYVELVGRDEARAHAMANALGVAKTNLGQYEAAEELLVWAVRGIRARFEPDSPWSKQLAEDLRALYAAWDQPMPDSVRALVDPD